MGRSISGRTRAGVVVGVCLLAGGGAAEAQRSSSAAPHAALTYDQAFGGSAYGSRDQDAVLTELPTIGDWVDATHYLETRRDADGQRRVYGSRPRTARRGWSGRPMSPP